MVQAIASRMANYVADSDETTDREVLAYGYSLIIMAAISYITVMVSAILFGVFREMLVAMGTFVLMRSIIGGVHASRRDICLVTYSGILYLCIVLARMFTISLYVVIIVYLINICLLVVYAPGDTVEQPMVRNRMKRKIFGLIIISCIFAFYILLQNIQPGINIMLFVSTSTCIFLHPYVYKLYGCERSKCS